MTRRCPQHATLLLLGLLLAVGSAKGAVVEVGASRFEGETLLVVSVRLLPGPGEAIASLQFDLHYDRDALDFHEATAGESARDAEKFLHHKALAAGKRRFVLAGFNQNAIAEGNIVECRFQIRHSGLSIVPIQLQRTILSDPFGTKIPVATGTAPAAAGQLPVLSQAEDVADLPPRRKALSTRTMLAVFAVLVLVVFRMRAKRKGTLL